MKLDLSPIELVVTELDSSSDFSLDDRFNTEWWNSNMVAVKGGRFSITLDGREVARARCSASAYADYYRDYIRTAGAKQLTSIDLLEVASDLRRNGIGKEAVSVLCQEFADSEMIALAAGTGAEYFWEALAWQRFDAVGGSNWRPLFVSPSATTASRSWRSVTEATAEIRRSGTVTRVTIQGIEDGYPRSLVVEVQSDKEDFGFSVGHIVQFGEPDGHDVIDELQRSEATLMLYWEKSWWDQVGSACLRVEFKDQAEAAKADRAILHG
ncbi:hypothetical protein [Salininema proteolyticum]|uniref:N-acetyltransferase domain-containing protein n=1 Tax=Salininema proteolyticum TaxID=1607685 RepID=A0ABV8U2P4_9ACTN